MRSVLPAILSLFLALVSCQTTSIGNENKHENISSNLSLTILERTLDFQVGPPSLLLEISTSEDYPCSNYQIATSKELVDGTLRIEVHGIENLEICLTAIGPASTITPLEEEFDQLIISHQGIENEFLISIEDDVISLQPLLQLNSFFTYDTYHRLRENSFAFFCNSSADNQEVCTDFVKFMRESFTVESFSLPASGRNPYVEVASGYSQNSSSQYFTFQHGNDLNQIGELLRSYYLTQHANNTDLDLTIVGWNGMIFRNDQRLN